MKKENQEKIIIYLRNLILRCLILVVLFLSLAILSKRDFNFKNKLFKDIYEKNMSFSKINNLYNKYMGNILPIQINEKVSPVFSEKLEYDDFSIYHDGVLLRVNDGYLIPSVEAGMVTYIGEKENYGNVIIVNTSDDMNIWYGNIDKAAVKLFDYVEKGEYLGNTVGDKLYLVYSKDNTFLDYKEYLDED